MPFTPVTILTTSSNVVATPAGYIPFADSGWVAVIIVLPKLKTVTVVPDTVATAGLLLLYVIGTGLLKVTKLLIEKGAAVVDLAKNGYIKDNSLTTVCKPLFVFIQSSD